MQDADQWGIGRQKMNEKEALFLDDHGDDLYGLWEAAWYFGKDPVDDIDMKIVLKLVICRNLRSAGLEEANNPNYLSSLLGPCY
jgi:hypothetical protein